MAEERKKYEDTELEQAPVYQAPQAKAIQFYVPLPVFAVECVVTLLGMWLMGPWIFLLMLPIHMLLVFKTAANNDWVENIICDYKYRFLKKNNGQHGKGVVTFTPHVNRYDMRKEMKTWTNKGGKNGN